MDYIYIIILCMVLALALAAVKLVQLSAVIRRQKASMEFMHYKALSDEDERMNEAELTLYAWQLMEADMIELREAINEHSNEVNRLNGYKRKLEDKLQALRQRIEDMQMQIDEEKMSHQATDKNYQKAMETIRLQMRENSMRDHMVEDYGGFEPNSFSTPKAGAGHSQDLEECSSRIGKQQDYYAAGHYIIREGEKGDSIFVINSGQVRVTQSIEGEHEPREIRILKQGDFFGEKALLGEEVRTTNVIAMTPGVEVLTLDRESLLKLIGDLDALRKDYGDLQRRATLSARSLEVQPTSPPKAELLAVENEFTQNLTGLTKDSTFEPLFSRSQFLLDVNDRDAGGTGLQFFCPFCRTGFKEFKKMQRHLGLKERPNSCDDFEKYLIEGRK